MISFDKALMPKLEKLTKEEAFNGCLWLMMVRSFCSVLINQIAKKHGLDPIDLRRAFESSVDGMAEEIDLKTFKPGGTE